MKKVLWFYLVSLILAAIGCSSQEYLRHSPTGPQVEVVIPETIIWREIDPDAMEEAVLSGKLIFFYVYDNNCEYCKLMQEGTFKNQELVKFLNENFYCIREKYDYLPMEVIESFEVFGVPKVLVLSQGNFVSIKGYQKPDGLMTLLKAAQEALEANEPL